MIKHVINFSGGKDSTAIYLLALERGLDFRAVFADTNNENPLTIEFVKNIHLQTGGPKVEFHQADFTDKFKLRREKLQTVWSSRVKRRNSDLYYEPLPQSIIDEALAVLHPTGNVFLDMCLLHGRMPSTRARFCSEELKRDVVFNNVLIPIEDAGDTVISWQGIRADESNARKDLNVIDELSDHHVIYRPIILWTAKDVFAMHRKHNIKPNPLYKLGMSRVGCMPCIHSRKGELREITTRFPEELERIAEWERIVAKVNRWCVVEGQDAACFFGPNTISRVRMAPINKIIEWSKTAYGGKQIAMDYTETPPACSSIYGLCE